eukprot:5801930-Amphidinium_carterae.3
MSPDHPRGYFRWEDQGLLRLLRLLSPSSCSQPRQAWILLSYRNYRRWGQPRLLAGAFGAVFSKASLGGELAVPPLLLLQGFTCPLSLPLCLKIWACTPASAACQDFSTCLGMRPDHVNFVDPFRVVIDKHTCVRIIINSWITSIGSALAQRRSNSILYPRAEGLVPSAAEGKKASTSQKNLATSDLGQGPPGLCGVASMWPEKGSRKARATTAALLKMFSKGGAPGTSCTACPARRSASAFPETYVASKPLGPLLRLAALFDG